MKDSKAIEIRYAKIHFSDLLRNVEKGEEITLLRSGIPVAKIVPFRSPSKNRIFDRDAGKIWIADDFDHPVDPESFKRTKIDQF